MITEMTNEERATINRISPIQERAVHVAAWFADKVRVTDGGNNRGFWVDLWNKACGVVLGSSWCASTVSAVLYESGWRGFKSASVYAWREFGKKHQIIAGIPERGALAFWHRGKSHHIGIVLGKPGDTVSLTGDDGKLYQHLVLQGTVATIEGNTSSGQHGSQNNGDGMYRKLRKLGDFDGYIRWWLV